MHETATTTELPTIAIVGRPNVGKSTLFNRLTKTRAALVSDFPGLTRDRQYGIGRVGSPPYIIIDTGGLTSEQDQNKILTNEMTKQTWQAVKEADAVLFLVDAREGLNSEDYKIAEQLRKTNQHIYLVANKIDNLPAIEMSAEFYDLGLGDVWAIAAEQNRNIKPLISKVLIDIVKRNPEFAEIAKNDDSDSKDTSIRVALIGRPNVGKSTLTNRILGEERVVVSDIPGTTRDSICCDFTRRGTKYTLIDTAGVRRKSKTKDKIEKFSVIKTLQSIEACNVALLLIDAQENITDQDLALLGFILDAGKALVIAANKWDYLSDYQRNFIKDELDRRLQFIDFAKIHFISALHGTGVGNLFSSIRKAYKSATADLATHDLTEILQAALANFEPPLIKGRRLKLRYAHAGGKNPPLIIVHGNNLKVPPNYHKYLQRFFRKALHLSGTPLKIIFKKGDNPFAKAGRQ